MERIKRLVAEAEDRARENGHVMRAFNYYGFQDKPRQRAHSECIHCGKAVRVSSLGESYYGEAIDTPCNQLYKMQRLVLRERIHNMLLTTLQSDSSFFKTLENMLMCPAIIARLYKGEKDQELQDLLLMAAITKTFRYRRNIDRRLFSTLMRYQGKKHTKHIQGEEK